MKNKILNLILIIILFLILGGCTTKKVKLIINSEPQDGDLYLRPLNVKSEWIYYGKTPLNLELKRRYYEVKIEKNNYVTIREKIKISEREEALNFKFNKVPILWKKPLSSNNFIIVDNFLIYFTGGSSKSKISNKEAINTIDLSTGKTVWSLSINDIYNFLKKDFLLRLINYSGDKINLYYLSSIEKDLGYEILFISLENGKIYGNLITYPIFSNNLKETSIDKIEKTYIKFNSPSYISWEKEIKGYYKFISYYNNYLYFIEEENNKKTKIIKIDSNNGDIEKEIFLNDIQDANIVYPKQFNQNNYKIFFTSIINNKFTLICFSLNEEKIIWKNREIFNLPIIITENLIYQFNGENKIGISIDINDGKIIKKLSPKEIENLDIPFEGKIIDFYSTEKFLFIISSFDNALYCFDAISKELIFKYNEEKIVTILGSKDSMLYLLDTYDNIITIDLNKL